MRFWKSWIVAAKDLNVVRKNKYVLYSLIGLPLLMGVILPVIFIFSLESEASLLNQEQLIAAGTQFVNLVSSYFVVIAAVLPTIIASYSFVGEKLEKSLEPLLATPTTDGELLFGKSLASFIPCIAASYIGALIFAIITDVWSLTNFGVLFVPTVYWGLIVGVMTPLVCVLSVEANVIISSRVNDIRAAQQIGAFIVLPIIILMIFASTIRVLPLETLALVLSGVLAAADVGLFFLSKATFQREEILTKWK